jgi:hypothetical protein
MIRNDYVNLVKKCLLESKLHENENTIVKGAQAIASGLLKDFLGEEHELHEDEGDDSQDQTSEEDISIAVGDIRKKIAIVKAIMKHPPLIREMRDYVHRFDMTKKMRDHGIKKLEYTQLKDPLIHFIDALPEILKRHPPKIDYPIDINWLQNYLRKCLEKKEKEGLADLYTPEEMVDLYLLLSAADEEYPPIEAAEGMSNEEINKYKTKANEDLGMYLMFDFDTKTVSKIPEEISDWANYGETNYLDLINFSESTITEEAKKSRVKITTFFDLLSIMHSDLEEKLNKLLVELKRLTTVKAGGIENVSSEEVAPEAKAIQKVKEIVKQDAKDSEIEPETIKQVEELGNKLINVETNEKKKSFIQRLMDKLRGDDYDFVYTYSPYRDSSNKTDSKVAKGSMIATGILGMVLTLQQLFPIVGQVKNIMTQVNEPEKQKVENVVADKNIKPLPLPLNVKIVSKW